MQVQLAAAQFKIFSNYSLYECRSKSVQKILCPHTDELLVYLWFIPSYITWVTQTGKLISMQLCASYKEKKNIPPKRQNSKVHESQSPASANHLSMNYLNSEHYFFQPCAPIHHYTSMKYLSCHKADLICGSVTCKCVLLHQTSGCDVV